MHINNIHIVNFRGFEDVTCSLDESVSVVVGNNTAGKTSFLQAILVGLGAYIQCLKHLSNGIGYRRNFTEQDRFLKYNPKLRDYVPNKDNTRVTINGSFVISTDHGYEEKPVTWYREFTAKGSTTHNRQCAGQLIDLVTEMEDRRWNLEKNSVYPLVLSFGTNRIDAQYRTAKKTKERQQRIDKAYKSALMNTVDFAGAMEWLNHYDKSLKDKKEFSGTKEAFMSALGKAIPALSEIDIDNKEIEAVVSVTGRHPSRHHYSHMSDGFKAMINIVSEIAYRCIELNGFLGEHAVEETPGIVVIDEVDLYLHPHWQRHVLSDLQNAFPKIQFVVTTHSPFIIQSVGRGQLISFDDNASVEGEPNKQSLEEIAETRMDMAHELRSKKYNEMVATAEDYFQLVSKGQEDSQKAQDIKSKLDLMESRFSDDPGYVALLKSERGKR